MSEEKRQLVEVIAALRSDIEDAILEGNSKNVKFDLEEIEVDLKVSITDKSSDKVDGKAGFNIMGLVNLGVGNEISNENTEEFAHTIKLRLTPKVKDPETGEYVKPKNVSGRD